MPTYLCHGFRWHRPAIRIFVLINNLEDAAPDWVVGRTTAALILGQFRRAFDFLPSRPPSPLPAADERLAHVARTPRGDDDDDDDDNDARDEEIHDEVLPHRWSPITLLEEYDVDEMALAARPYAYVADYVIRVDLGASVAEAMATYRGLAAQRHDGWFEKLRDRLQAKEDIGWYVVVCADEERAVPGDERRDDDGSEYQEDDDDGPRKEDDDCQNDDDKDHVQPPQPPPVKDHQPLVIRQK